MKYILLTLVFIGSLHAGIWTTAQAFNDPEIKTNKFSLDTYGLNPRVYQFSTEHMHCVIIYTENDVAESKQGKMAPVMQCVKK